MSTAAVKSNRPVMVPLGDLKVTFFVRRELNQDRVLQLMELYEAGVDVEPLKITHDNEVVDGRHRKAALEHLNRTEARCIFTETTDRIDLIVEGFSENMGGSLPPTRVDIVAVLCQLIEEGGSQRRLLETISPVLPKSVCRIYMKQAYAEIAARKMRSAINSITDKGRTIAQAADEFGIDPERIKEELTGRNKRRREKTLGIPALKNSLSQRYKGNTLKTWSEVRRILEQLEDGAVTEKQARSVLGHIEKLMKQGLHSHKGWVERLEAAVPKKK